jgi:hypothetical protein
MAVINGRYDAQGNLTGDSVAETLVIKEVSRPMEDKNPTVSYFSVDKNSSKAAWPPSSDINEHEPATPAEVTSITTEPASPLPFNLLAYLWLNLL